MGKERNTCSRAVRPAWNAYEKVEGLTPRTLLLHHLPQSKSRTEWKLRLIDSGLCHSGYTLMGLGWVTGFSSIRKEAYLRNGSSPKITKGLRGAWLYQSGDVGFSINSISLPLALFEGIWPFPLPYELHDGDRFAIQQRGWEGMGFIMKECVVWTWCDCFVIVFNVSLIWISCLLSLLVNVWNVIQTPMPGVLILYCTSEFHTLKWLCAFKIIPRPPLC